MKWILFIFLAACAHENYNLSENYSSYPNLFKVWATHIKDKGRKYSVDFNMRNESKEPLIVNLSDIKCYKGNILGELNRHIRGARQGVGEKIIDLGPGETKSFELLCDFNHNKVKQGNFSIIIERIFDNPPGDHKTSGKVLARELTWKAISG